ncbi:MAG: hypothetical protein CR972_05125 [Candidatus Moraniibacteriota bacterium]|nr:MAG: hypothetical protein CR972_05125 [Candidatus Moranbacteria bacterium]
MEDFRDKKKYYPVLVSAQKDKKDTQEDIIKIQEKYRLLPQKAHNLLGCDNLISFIYGVEQRFRLQDEQTEEFSRLVRKYFFREVTEGDFVKRIAYLCKISPDEALKLLRAILTIKPETEKKQERNIVKMTLKNALSSYPQILDQVITEQEIISKPFLKPLKPTVKNWIMVYEKLLGVSRHNALERGEFIFRSQVTKNISDEEEQKLSLLFKSRDEDNELVIDPEKKEIIFTRQEEFEEQKIQEQVPQAQSNTQNTTTQKQQEKKEKTINTQNARSFDMISSTTQPSVAKIDSGVGRSDRQIDASEEKGIFGTETYLSGSASDRDGQRSILENEINDNKKEEGMLNSQDELLQESGEHDYFVANENQFGGEGEDVFLENEHFGEDSEENWGYAEQNRGNESQRQIGTAHREVNDIGSFQTTSSKVLVDKNIDQQIEREQEELTQVKDRMEKMISEMRDVVEVPRNIGERIEEKEHVNKYKEYGNFTDEIEQNQKDLYGVEYVEEKIKQNEIDAIHQKEEELEQINKIVEAEKQEFSSNNNAETLTENTKNKNSSAVKKNSGNITFSSNHVLPSEKERQNTSVQTGDYFSIKPMGQMHTIETDIETEK